MGIVIYLAATFVTMGFLSTLFNSFFYSVNVIGFDMQLNISVVFFCLGFFVLDLVTELYDDKVAMKLINAKILCQLLFVTMGAVGVFGAGLGGTQLAEIISATPYMVFCSIIAAVIGYNLTIKIMQRLKVIYSGKFLALRYLASTLPGELVFSAVFSYLSFSSGRDLDEYLAIFIALSLVKIACSIVFSILVVPITIGLRYFAAKSTTHADFVPFQ